jgi:hypothetical protein
VAIVSEPVFMRSLILALVLFLALGCENISGPLSPSERKALDIAERRWRSQNLAAYSYEGRVGCFCPPELNEWATVEVRNGRVTAVRSLDGTLIPSERWFGRQTIDELFTLIRERRDIDWVKDIVVEFDATLGYPKRASFESKPNIADAGAAYEVRNVRRLPEG